MTSGSNVTPAAPAVEEPARSGHLIVAGAIATVVWLGLLAGYVCLRWADLAALEPNAVGDFLAGAFAPLAFLWLVLGFFQQGIELRNSGDALWLQGEELRNSVEQQRELVAVTREQLTFESEVLAAQRAETRRNAQPVITLTVNGSSATGGVRRQSFSVSNHGKSCTRVLLRFSDSAKSIAWNSLPSGNAQSIIKKFTEGQDAEWIVFISYLDELLIPGATAFVVTFSAGQTSIVEQPDLRPEILDLEAQ